MAGWSDYSNQNVANYMAGSLAMPALPSLWLALFTAAFTSNAGTGGTEATGNAYARQQIAGPLTANAVTTASAVLHFASVPTWIVPGMLCRDVTTPANVPTGTTVVSTVPGASGTVTISNTVTTTATEVFTFSAFAAATASVGSEPAAQPGGILSNANITFVQATGTGWGTIVSFAAYDAVTSGNMIWWDFLGTFKWLPFTGSSASPSVLTSPAHGYSNGDQVAVTTKYGGTLPATAGSWAFPLTVASVATDTFTAGVNTTTTGDGLVRKVATQPIAGNVTASFASGQLTLTDA